MIRYLLNAARSKFSSQAERVHTDPLPSTSLQLEPLEERIMLAFVGFFDGGTSTLTLTQTFDDGNITIDNNGGAGEFRTIDGAGTIDFVAADNLVVNLIDSTGNQLDLDLDNAVAGDVELNLGDGTRAVNFTGASNSIGGSLMVTGGSDNQTVEVAVAANLSVGTNASFDLGTGFDTVDEDGNDVAILGDLGLVGVNEFENNGTMSIGGNITVDSSGETETTRFDDDSAMAIGGNFTFTGGDGRDEVLLNDVGVTTVGGNVYVDLANNTVGGTQFVWWNSTDTTINGNVTILSTNSATADDVQDLAGATVNGDILIDLGDGANQADLLGTIGGSTVEYTGGSGVDDVTYDMSGSFVDVTVILGADDDIFTLGPNVTIAPTTLTVDFGDNNDTFNNNFGNFTFNTMLLGLSGFDYHYDFATDTLTATEGSNAGLVEFDTNGIGGAFRFNNSLDITTAANLTVNMLDNSGNQLDIDLDVPLAGDLNINLGDGTRTLTFNSGASNAINGNVLITGGADAQTVEVAPNTGFSVAGDVAMDLGTGNDIVDEDGNDIAIGGNLDFIGVNRFENNGSMSVGGNVNVDNSGETETSSFDDDQTMTIGGNFTYAGGDGQDEVLQNGTAGGTGIAGDVSIDLGDNVTGGEQNVFFNVAGSSVGGALTVTSTASLNGDTFLATGAATFGDDIDIDLGGGTNTATIVGTFGGSRITYRGGDGTDTVSFGTTGNPADVNAILGTGDDTFTLQAGAVIDPTTLRVDFGGGVDTFNNLFGQFTFDARLVNLNGFNYVYTAATDFLNILQVLDVGDITLDNNGAGGAIRIENGLLTETTPATDVRLNLLANTGGNLTVDLDSALNGFLHLELRNGARDVTFTGTDNSMAGRFRIEAGSGVQNIDLAVNADLNVGGNTVINLRSDHDTVDDGTNNLNFGGAVIFRSVNLFENKNTMNVFGDFRMVSIHEVQDTRLDNDGSMNIGGNFDYLGGTALDEVVLNAGVSIAGVAFIHVGSASGVTAPQIVNLTGGFSVGGRLSVAGDTATFGNSVTTDSTTTVGGNVIVNFTNSAGNNTVMLYGTYGGNYGTYRGGSALDHVAFGATATDMRFVTFLFDGNDEFTLDAGVTLLSGRLDGGNGIDTFIDNVGEPYPFPFEIVNIP